MKTRLFTQILFVAFIIGLLSSCVSTFDPTTCDGTRIAAFTNGSSYNIKVMVVDQTTVGLSKFVTPGDIRLGPGQTFLIDLKPGDYLLIVFPHPGEVPYGYQKFEKSLGCESVNWIYNEDITVTTVEYVESTNEFRMPTLFN